MGLRAPLIQKNRTMNHARRNRNKIRLSKGKQQRISEANKFLRKYVGQLQNEREDLHSKLNHAMWRARNAEDALRDQEIRTYEKRVMPTKPPAPFKYWYEVFIVSQDTIMRSGFNSRLIVPADLDNINATSMTSINAVDVSLQDILFGTLRELSDFVIPRSLVRKVEEEIQNSILRGNQVFTNGDGTVKYEGEIVNLRLMHAFSQLKQRYRR